MSNLQGLLLRLPIAGSVLIGLQEKALRGIALIISLTKSYIGRFLPQIMALLTKTVSSGTSAVLKLVSLQNWSLLANALAKESLGQLSSNINQVSWSCSLDHSPQALS